MGMLGGWYSDPTEQQQALRKTASVRVDTSLGPEYHVRPVASAAQAPPQVWSQYLTLFDLGPA